VRVMTHEYLGSYETPFTRFWPALLMVRHHVFRSNPWTRMSIILSGNGRDGQRMTVAWLLEGPGSHFQSQIGPDGPGGN